MMQQVTLKGKAFNLKGQPIQKGKVPNCRLIDNQMNEVALSQFQGKYLLLLSVPSLDTPVCSQEARRFNQEVGPFQDWLNVLCVSMDLPFAQARWCGAEGIKHISTLSDFKFREFGEKFGLLIPDLGLLARAVYLIAPNMEIEQFHLVQEISQEPDYETILKSLKNIPSKTR